MGQTAPGVGVCADRSRKEKQVESILGQMAAVLKNLRTYDRNNPVLEKSFNSLQQGLLRFVKENESLTLLVREDALVYGNRVAYQSDNKLDSLAFAFYRDGIRLLSFLDSLTPEGLWEFLVALDEARSADPYEADLVTIMWEKDISGLRYKAVEAYMEDEEEKKIKEMAESCPDQPVECDHGDLVLGPAFFINELGLTPRSDSAGPPRAGRPVTEAESASIVQEIFQEDDHSLMKQCSEICLELVRSADSDEIFDSVAGFLGRICDWLVDWGDLISASTVLSELRSVVEKEDETSPHRATVLDTIARLGETKKIERVASYIADPDKTRLDEVFAYLVMMEPVAVRPLFDILADSEIREVRYMLCRALSIISRHEPDRLRLYLLDKRWYVVRNAVTIIGLIGSVDAIPSLGLTSGHSEARVRREVARALGRIKDPAGLAILADLVNDDKEEVRLEALQAIRKVGCAHTSGLIEECIRDKTFEKRSSEEKKEIFKIYGSVGTGSLDLLEPIVRGNVPNVSEKTRAAAVYGIAAVGHKKAFDLLNSLKGEADGVVKGAVMEILSFGSAASEWTQSDEG
jgi:hypothetical protein